jgi:hypothetical protein
MEWMKSLEAARQSVDEYVPPELVEEIVPYYISVEHLESLLESLTAAVNLGPRGPYLTDAELQMPTANSTTILPLRRWILHVFGADVNRTVQWQSDYHGTFVRLVLEAIQMYDFDGPTSILYRLIDELILIYNRSSDPKDDTYEFGLALVKCFLNGFIDLIHRGSCFWMVTMQRLYILLQLAYQHPSVAKEFSSRLYEKKRNNMCGWLWAYPIPPYYSIFTDLTQTLTEPVLAFGFSESLKSVRDNESLTDNVFQNYTGGWSAHDIRNVISEFHTVGPAIDWKNVIPPDNTAAFFMVGADPCDPTLLDASSSAQLLSRTFVKHQAIKVRSIWLTWEDAVVTKYNKKRLTVTVRRPCHRPHREGRFWYETLKSNDLRIKVD